MEEKPKKKVWKTAITINLTGLIIAIVVALGIAGADDNESIKNKTVATSTNPVETENEVTNQNYIANNEKKTNEEKSQQTATKDTGTTATTDKKNTSSNSVVEMSDVSFTGMVFKKSWSEFKNQIQQNTNNISAKWETVKPYSNKSLTEYGMLYIKYNARTQQPYVALQINFIVEDNTDKMIGMYCSIDNNSTPEDANLWWAIAILLDENVGRVGQKLLGQLQSYNGSDGWNPDVHSCFENNIFARCSYKGTDMNFFIHACNDEEAQYYRENGKWRNLQ